MTVPVGFRANFFGNRGTLFQAFGKVAQVGLLVLFIYLFPQEEWSDL